MDSSHAVLAVAVTALLLLRPSHAAVFVVGDSAGWTAAAGTDFYTTWAAGKNFRVGDTLTFDFTSNIHTVQSVKKLTHDNCVTTSNDGVIVSRGPANITLTTAGPHYYICTVPGHCTLGQKLQINVTRGSISTAPSSSPPVTPASAPTKPPVSEAPPSDPSAQTDRPPTVSPPPPSSSSLLMASVFSSLAFVVLGLVF